jgi:hypothetical protein
MGRGFRQTAQQQGHAGEYFRQPHHRQISNWEQTVQTLSRHQGTADAAELKVASIARLCMTFAQGGN